MGGEEEVGEGGGGEGDGEEGGDEEEVGEDAVVVEDVSKPPQRTSVNTSMKESGLSWKGCVGRYIP